MMIQEDKENAANNFERKIKTLINGWHLYYQVVIKLVRASWSILN